MKVEYWIHPILMSATILFAAAWVIHRFAKLRFRRASAPHFVIDGVIFGLILLGSAVGALVRISTLTPPSPTAVFIPVAQAEFWARLSSHRMLAIAAILSSTISFGLAVAARRQPTYELRLAHALALLGLVMIAAFLQLPGGISLITSMSELLKAIQE